MKSGRITAHRDETTGQPYLIAEEADRQWMANTDPTKKMGSDAIKLRKAAATGEAPRAPPLDEAPDTEIAPGVPSIATSKAKLEHFKALEREAGFLRSIGELVRSADVKKEAFERGRALREAILAVPDRLHAELTAETDPNRVHARLTEELIIALETALAPAEPQEEEATA